MERTTDLEQLRKGAPYTWGNIIRIHDIAEYTIIEYYPWQTKGASSLVGEPSDKVSYHFYINGNDSCRSTDSMDSALAEAIAYKHDGVNSQAGHYFIKSLQEEE